jgi:hypothetical protein
MNTTKLVTRYWQVECEDRDTDYPGWHHDEDDRFLSVSQAIEEAKWLAESEGAFFKRFRVVEVNVVTEIIEIEVFEANNEN